MSGVHFWHSVIELTFAPRCLTYPQFYPKFSQSSRPRPLTAAVKPAKNKNSSTRHANAGIRAKRKVPLNLRGFSAYGFPWLLKVRVLHPEEAMG